MTRKMRFDRLRTSRLVIVLLCAASVGTLGGWAAAQDTEEVDAAAAVRAYSADQAAPTTAPEQDLCAPAEGTDSIDVGYWDDIYVPCFVQYDSCKQHYVLNVGEVRVGKGTGTSYMSEPDNFFQSGECGYGTYAGYVNSSYDLYIYAGNAIGINFDCSTSLKVGVQLVAEEYYSNNCTGSVVRTLTDNQHCTINCVDNTGYAHLQKDGIGRCTVAGTFEEEDESGFAEECRMPDMWINKPGTLPASYKIKLQSAIWRGGSWQNWTEQVGCFYIS